VCVVLGEAIAIGVVVGFCYERAQARDVFTLNGGDH